MQNEYMILMDVSGDLDENVARENDIRYVPMDYSIGEEMRTSEGQEPADIIKKFYDGQRGGDLTRTSQIAPQKYEKVLKPYLSEGVSVLYLCLSSGLSSTYQSACLTKNKMKEKYPDADFYPVDTLSATGGMGLLCERAIRNRKNGMTIEENYNDLVTATHHIRHWFVVPDLMYLKRGGRVSATTAAFGTMLHVKPLLIIDTEGKLQTISKERGNKAAVRALAADFKENWIPSDDVIYIVDADNRELSDQLEASVREIAPDATIRRHSLSPIIGAHTGPDMFAVIHMGK